MGSDQFKIMLKAELDKTSLSTVEKELLMKNAKIPVDLDLTNFIKSKQEISKLVESLAKEIKTNVGDSTSDKQINLWADQYRKAIEGVVKDYDKISVAAQKSADLIRQTNQKGTFDAQISKAQSDLQKYGLTAEEASGKLKGMKDALVEINASGNDNQALIIAGEKIKLEYDKIKNVIIQTRVECDKTSRASKNMVTELQKVNTSTNLRNYLANNTNLPPTAVTSVKEWIAALESVDDMTKDDFDNLRANFKRLDTDMRESGNLGFSQTDKILQGLDKFGTWFSVAAIFTKSVQSIKNGVTSIYGLDTALVDLKKTSDATGKELTDFYYTANDVGKSLGASTKDIIQAAADWSRLGYSIRDAKIMAENSSILSSISPDIDITKATDGLVSTLKAFRLEADDSLDGIISKINIIGNTQAVSNGDLVDILTRSSSAMAAANNTLEQTIALGTAATEITRNSAEVGTALKTMSMRIRGYSEETEGYTEDIEILSGTIANLTKTAKTPGGISLFTDDTKETFKSTYQLLEEISAIYSDLTDVEQADLLEALAGKRQGQIMAALISNFDAAKSSMESMANSAGNAMEEMEVIYDSIDYKLNRLKETGVGIAQNIFKQDDIKLVIDGFTGIADILDIVTEKLGLFGTIGTGAGLLGFIKNFTQLKSLGDSQQALGEITKALSMVSDETKILEGVTAKYSLETIKLAAAQGTLSKEQIITTLTAKGLSIEEATATATTITMATAEKAATASTIGLGTAVQGLSIKLKTLSAAHPILVALTAALGIAYMACKAYDLLTVSMEEAIEAATTAAQKNQELIDKISSINSELETTNSKIKELESRDSLSFIEQNELEKLKETTAELERQLNLAIALQNVSSNEARDTAIEYYEKKDGRHRYGGWSMTQVESGNDQFGIGIEDLYSGTQLEITQQMLNDYDTFVSRYKELNKLKEEFIAANPENYKDSNEYLNLAFEANNLQSAIKALDIDIPDFIKNIGEFKGSLNANKDATLIQQINEVQDLFNETFGGESSVTNKFNSLWESIDFKRYREELIELAEAGKITPEVIESNENYNRLIESTGATATEVANHIKSQFGSLGDIGSTMSSNAIFNISSEGISKGIDDFQSKLNSLSSALTKVKDNKLTGSELLDLQQQFPELIGQTDNLSEALTNLIDNTLTDVIDFLDHAGAPDDLIDSFRQIAEEAKGISFDGWKETLDVFDKVNSSMSSLSDFTKALGKDYAITATEARKFAEVFPELLALGETTSSGLIQFNKGVVDAFIDGKQTEIKVDAEARIQELNNQKAVIEGKMALAQAELLLLEGQGNAKIEAENQTNEGIAEAQKNLVQYLVNLGTEEANADATVKEIMAGNTEEYDRVVAEVSGNVHDNLSNSISGAADNVDTSSHSMIDSLYSVAQQAVNTAKSIASIGSENPFEAVKTTLNGAKNAIKGFNPVESISDFKRMVGENIDIDQYTRSERMVKLELDITGYQETLSGIESQIALLEASGNKSLKDYDTGSGGSKKSKEEAEKEIDWAERTLKQLKEQRDELEKKSSSSFLAYLGLTPEEFEKARLIVESTDTLMTKDLRELRDIAQNAGMSMSDLIDLVENGGDTESKRSYLSQLIEHDKLALRTYDFAIDAYRKKYDELAKDISPEDLNKIENNSMDISLYSGDDAKKIEDVIDAYEKWKNTVKGKAELEAEANDNIKNYYDNNIEYLDHQAKRIESTNSLINSQINYLKESGQIVSATSYEQLISNNKQIISYYEQKIKEAEKKLAELMSKEDFDITSKEYYDIQEELSGYRQVIIDTDVEVQQLANDLLNLPIDNMDIVISMYESITDTIQRWGSEMEASGKKLDKEYYQSLINNGMTVIDQYKEQYDLVRDVMDEYDTGSEKWNTLYNKLQSINSAMSSMVENLYKWNEALLQLPFDSVSTLSDNLTKALSAMTNVQSEYDTVISAVVGALQEEIDLLNEARDAANEETEAQIDELKSRLDLLNQQNEALKLQAAYEQALYDLQNANTQKTERVIRDGQLVYETNADNLRQAQSDVQDALLDLEKYNLEQEIEALEEQLDAVNDQYEEQIKNLEKISEKWSEITSKIEQAKNEVTATDILGDGWKDKVLSGNDDDIFNMFSGMYQSISDQITLYEDQIASTENIEVLLQDYITAYKEGTITYEQAMTGINDLLSQLNEKMSATDNLNNVLDYVGAVTGTDDTSISGILSALQKSLQETGDELIKSFELYNENAGNISEYTTSWQQLTIDVSDIKDILEEVRDNLEDTLDNISRSRDRDEDLEDDLGDTSSNGGRAIGVGDASGSSYHGSSVDSSNDDQDPNNGPGVYAKGMENGLVGANTDSNREGILKKMVLNRIEDPANAIPIIAHEGEAILNRSQQDTLIENYYNAYESYPSIPDWFANYKMPTYDFSGIGKSSEGDILCHNEKIIIEKCDNPDQLAEGILKGGLASAMRMRAGRR